MWYKVDPNGFRNDELLRLYQIVDVRERSYRDDLFRFTNFYSAVCYAILGITLSGFISLHDKGWISIALLFGPILTLCMCLLGMRVTGRIYHRIVEEISTKAKLENLLGLDKPLTITQFLGKEPCWPKDEALLPPRHAERRWREDNSAQFIAGASRSGFYRDNRLYFILIGIFSVLLGLSILAVGFRNLIR